MTWKLGLGSNGHSGRSEVIERKTKRFLENQDGRSLMFSENYNNDSLCEAFFFSFSKEENNLINNIKSGKVAQIKVVLE